MSTCSTVSTKLPSLLYLFDQFPALLPCYPPPPASPPQDACEEDLVSTCSTSVKEMEEEEAKRSSRCPLLTFIPAFRQ